MSEVFDLQMGKTPSRDNLRYWNGTETWVSISDMGVSKYIDSSKEQITTQAVQESGIKMVPKGCVIMSFKLSVGKTAISNKDLYTNEAIMAFKPKEEHILLPDYIYYYLRGYKWDGVNRAAMGLTLNKASISKGFFSYPSLQEQERIVAELDLLTGIIDKQKQQLRELDTLAQSIFYDMFGNPVENDKGWEKKQIGKICTSKKQIQRASKRFKDSDIIRYIDISSIDNINNVMTSTTSYGFGDAPSRAQQVVELGDVLISLVRPNLNNVAMVSEDGTDLVASSGFCVLRANCEIVKEFLFYSVKMKCFTDYLMQRVSGANYPAVREDDITGYNIILPPLELQESFAKKIQAIESQKQSINRSIAESQKLFDYTMDKYFG